MNKEKLYKEKLEMHWTSNWYDYLNNSEVSELKKDVTRRAKKEGTEVLEGTNKKATITWSEDGTIILTSYYTDVLDVLPDGTIVKRWDGYSATTMRHINALMAKLNLPLISKREWVMMESVA